MLVREVVQKAHSATTTGPISKEPSTNNRHIGYASMIERARRNPRSLSREDILLLQQALGNHGALKFLQELFLDRPLPLGQENVSAQPETKLLFDPPYQIVPPNDRTKKTRGINEAIQQDLQGAIDQVRELSGIDLGTEFGDTSRPLESAPTKAGAVVVSWHKTGRAIDLSQNSFNKGVIAKDPSGNDMLFRIYLPYKNATAKESDLTEQEKPYLKKWETVDKASFSKTPQKNKWYVDVTAIFEGFGFERIKAKKNWETTQSEMEWWHYEKRDGLSMYRALRQIYTDDQIVSGYKDIYRSDKGKYRKRLLEEGFPEEILDKMERPTNSSSDRSGAALL